MVDHTKNVIKPLNELYQFTNYKNVNDMIVDDDSYQHSIKNYNEVMKRSEIFNINLTENVIDIGTKLGALTWEAIRRLGNDRDTFYTREDFLTKEVNKCIALYSFPIDLEAIKKFTRNTDGGYVLLVYQPQPMSSIMYKEWFQKLETNLMIGKEIDIILEKKPLSNNSPWYILHHRSNTERYNYLMLQYERCSSGLHIPISQLTNIVKVSGEKLIINNIEFLVNLHNLFLIFFNDVNTTIKNVFFFLCMHCEGLESKRSDYFYMISNNSLHFKHLLYEPIVSLYGLNSEKQEGRVVEISKPIKSIYDTYPRLSPLNAQSPKNITTDKPSILKTILPKTISTDIHDFQSSNKKIELSKDIKESTNNPIPLEGVLAYQIAPPLPRMNHPSSNVTVKYVDGVGLSPNKLITNNSTQKKIDVKYMMKPLLQSNPNISTQPITKLPTINHPAPDIDVKYPQSHMTNNVINFSRDDAFPPAPSYISIFGDTNNPEALAVLNTTHSDDNKSSMVTNEPNSIVDGSSIPYIGKEALTESAYLPEILTSDIPIINKTPITAYTSEPNAEDANIL